ncbi:hypothetical protein Aperf_G00000049048 [Anoplocephala perfoliata]
MIMDDQLQAKHPTELIPQSITEGDFSSTPIPILPYRSSTMPENLSMRLKHPNVLCTNAWLKKSTGDYPHHMVSRLHCSRRMEDDEFRSRPASMAPDARLSNKNHPPPLPPKRTCSKSPISPILTLKQPDFRLDLSEELEATELDGNEDDDICSALQKITKRLNQFNTEQSSILGHYSPLYRLDTCPHTQSPKSPSYLPRVRQLSQRPQRCAYTNLDGRQSLNMCYSKPSN